MIIEILSWVVAILALCGTGGTIISIVGLLIEGFYWFNSSTEIYREFTYVINPHQLLILLVVSIVITLICAMIFILISHIKYRLWENMEIEGERQTNEEYDTQGSNS
jgi:hypothetical protein